MPVLDARTVLSRLQRQRGTPFHTTRLTRDVPITIYRGAKTDPATCDLLETVLCLARGYAFGHPECCIFQLANDQLAGVWGGYVRGVTRDVAQRQFVGHVPCYDCLEQVSLGDMRVRGTVRPGRRLPAGSLVVLGLPDGYEEIEFGSGVEEPN